MKKLNQDYIKLNFFRKYFVRINFFKVFGNAFTTVYRKAERAEITFFLIFELINSFINYDC